MELREKRGGGSRLLYDYEHLLPFWGDAGEYEVCEHIKVCGLPIYQWSLGECGQEGELYGIGLLRADWVRWRV